MHRICALAFAGLTLAMPVASAETPAEFFHGKTINLGVGSGPGGGYDAYSRVLTRHYSRFIPGNPAVVIQYVPGAGGMVVANNTYTSAPKNGTYLAMIPASVLLDGVLGSDQAKFDASRFTFVGNMNEEADTCSFWHTSGIARTDDIFAKDSIIGTAGPASNSHTFPLVMNKVLGTKFKLIPGYGGGSSLRINAMEKGELQGACGIFVSTVLSQFGQQVKDGRLKVLLQMGLARHPAFPDAPNAVEFAKTDADRQILTLFFAQLALGRAIFAPPETPPDRAKALSDAFAATMNDPAFQADAERLNTETRWFGPERMAEVVKAMTATPEAVKARARELLAAN
ncbi:MAG: Bug family tripartite tricarboxylate transporter substrate binding protein [Gemmatimonas sp.]